MDVDYLALLLSRMDARTERITGFVATEGIQHSPGCLRVRARIHKKRRTWKENKNYKAEMKKDRGSFVKGVSGDHPSRVLEGGLPGAKEHRARGPKGQDLTIQAVQQEGPLGRGLSPLLAQGR